MAPESQLTRSRIENAGRLINACDPEFRPLARAGLETGSARVHAPEINDFNRNAGTLTIG
jgi:hypothetical protein